MNRREFVSTGLGVAAALATTAGQATRPTRAFDTAIIGAGLFGSAAARHLSKTAEGVVLIGPAEPSDPRNHRGAFASHFDASRLTRIVDPDLVWATMARRSIARYREIETSSGVGFFHEIGYMMVTPGGLGRDWFDLPAMREVASDLQVVVDDLGHADLAQRFPYLKFTPGSGAMLQQRDAGYFDPRALLRAQQELSIAQGAALVRDEVVYLRNTGEQVEIKTRSGDSLRANRALVATGAYANASNLLDVELAMQIRAAMIMVAEVDAATPANYPATLYAKTDGEQDFWGLLMPPVTYPDGRSYIKTMDGYYGPAALRTREDLGDWCRSRGHVDHHPVLRRALREVFPALDVRNSRFQPCLIADTKSGYPYIDMLDDRIGLVVGGNGKSAKSSDEIGRIAAHLIRTGEWHSALPRSLFAARFV